MFESNPYGSNVDLNRLADDLQSIIENTDQITTLSQRAMDSAGQGFQALSDVQRTLQSFVDGTRQINELLESIDLLSQQVHILGVNAAIEAANAGEHGKGFTIIAEEMRRIAGQVKETAASVQSIMGVTGKLADETVVAIDTASEQLEMLEVSAELSVQLNEENSSKAVAQQEALGPRNESPQQVEETGPDAESEEMSGESTEEEVEPETDTDTDSGSETEKED